MGELSSLSGASPPGTINRTWLSRRLKPPAFGRPRHPILHHSPQTLLFSIVQHNTGEHRAGGREEGRERVEAPQKWVELWSQRLYYLSAFWLLLSLPFSLSLNFSPFSVPILSFTALWRKNVSPLAPAPLFLWKTSYEKQYLGRGASLLIKESVDADVGWWRRYIREREPRWRRIKPALRSATSFLFHSAHLPRFYFDGRKEREILEERNGKDGAHNSGNNRVPISNGMNMSRSSKKDECNWEMRLFFLSFVL